ncbi:MAG: hypothetical protein ACI376_03960 [Candidatus Bruticola sp.]
MGSVNPDCPGCWLGQDYGEALAQAVKLGLAPRHVVVTRPPFKGLAQGRLRLLAVRPYPSLAADSFSDESFWQNLNSEANPAYSESWSGDWEWILAYPVFERAPREQRKKN